MQQVALVLVGQEDFDDGIEDVFLDHVVDAVCVFGHHYRLEELDDFDIDLDGLKPEAVSHMLHHFLIDEERPDLVLVDIVCDEPI